MWISRGKGLGHGYGHTVTLTLTRTLTRTSTPTLTSPRTLALTLTLTVTAGGPSLPQRGGCARLTPTLTLTPIQVGRRCLNEEAVLGALGSSGLRLQLTPLELAGMPYLEQLPHFRRA